MIVEVIFATVTLDGRPNFAPMGVTWGDDLMVVRPFRNTHTYRNLLATGCGVVNITDDVSTFVETALADPELPHFSATSIRGVVLANACSWRELMLVDGGAPAERAEMRCRVVGSGRQRDFLGFNRARGAIIEATILATRVALLGQAHVLACLQEYETVVLKTGDAPEWAALRRIRDYVRGWPHEDNH